MHKVKRHHFLKKIIEEYRIRSINITRKELAKLAGISETSLSLIMNAHTSPRLATMQKIEDALTKAGL